MQENELVGNRFVSAEQECKEWPFLVGIFRDILKYNNNPKTSPEEQSKLLEISGQVMDQDEVNTIFITSHTYPERKSSDFKDVWHSEEGLEDRIVGQFCTSVLV